MGQVCLCGHPFHIGLPQRAGVGVGVVVSADPRSEQSHMPPASLRVFPRKWERYPRTSSAWHSQEFSATLPS